MHERLDRRLAGKRILVDAEHLLLAHGTGIATYTRNLVASLAGMGASVEALLDVGFAPSARDAPFNRQRLFAPRDPDEMSRWLPIGVRRRLAAAQANPAGLRRYLIGLGAKPRGLQAGPLDTSPRDEAGALPEELAVFRRALAARELKINARQHAIRWRKPLPLQLQDAFKPDLFHAAQVLPARIPGRPLIVTIHDIIPIVMPGAFRANAGHERIVVEAILRHADHVITVSEHARADLIQHFGADEARVSNTYQPVDIGAAEIDQAEEDMEECLRFHGLDRGEYFIFCGSIEPKKNVRRLVEGFAGSGTRRKLVLAGGLGWDYDDALRAIDDERFAFLRPDGEILRHDRQVRRLPYLPRRHLRALLRGARAMVFPSLYEGFGLPAVEAMALDVPVIASRTTALGEIAAGAARLVDPTDVIDIARAIRELDGDSDLRVALRAAGLERARRFSPENHSARLAAVYAKVL